MMQLTADQVKTPIYAAVVGDALGIPYANRQRHSFQATDMIGYGTHLMPIGTWSDDTSLSLCLMRNLTDDGTLTDLMKMFKAYRDIGYLTPKEAAFDIGITTNLALDNFDHGVAPDLCGGQNLDDNGNGSIMRLAPLAFALLSEPDFKKRCLIIEQYTSLTHRHPRAIVGSIIYVELLYVMLHGNGLRASLAVVASRIREYTDLPRNYREQLIYYERLFKQDFLRLPEAEIQSSGYVLDTLEAAVWSVGNSKSIRSAILTATNLGGDTDTIASIAGSIAGLLYPYQSIPKPWLDKLVNPELLASVINPFVNKVISIGIRPNINLATALV